MKDQHLLILEPYWGGSHSQFLGGLQQHIGAHCQVMSLPARNWKMRMQLSAPWALNCLRKLSVAQRWFDTVLCSTFVDVAVLRGLLTTLEGWNPTTRFCTYFHENQFAYPGQFGQDPTPLTGKSPFTINSAKKRANTFSQGLNRQFAAINYTSALVSDRLAFNSLYNRQTFLDGCNQYLRKAGDMGVQYTAKEIEEKSRILPPGLDFSLIDQASTSCEHTRPVIVWNHRWEHDKNPEEFFAALCELKKQGLDFRLIVLGQSFTREPLCFKEARTVLADRILHFGYAPSRKAYADLLQKGTIVVSTARHEFFGIAVLEAVRAGCRPLLPDRLAYPELFEGQYLYGENGLFEGLRRLLRNSSRLDTEELMKITEKYSWQVISRDFTAWLFGA